MADMFSLNADQGNAMNTTSVKENGDNIVQFGTDLQTLLADFDEVITTLTSNGMTGGMSDKAKATYAQVKDSLEKYATSLVNTGNAVLQAAADTEAASNSSADALSVMA